MIRETYNIQQSIEAGYRTSLDQWEHRHLRHLRESRSGLRLFDYTLDMRSLDHNGLLFDNLNFSNFGYGGDPNDVTRLRIDKNKWYDFRVLFRRDKNFWDYNLLANPLNPSTSTPCGGHRNFAAFAGSGSPHAGLQSDVVSAIAGAPPAGLFA